MILYWNMELVQSAFRNIYINILVLRLLISVRRLLMGKSFPLSPSKYWVPTLEQLDIAINTALEEEELRIRQERLVQPNSSGTFLSSISKSKYKIGNRVKSIQGKLEGKIVNISEDIDPIITVKVSSASRETPESKFLDIYQIIPLRLPHG